MLGLAASASQVYVQRKQGVVTMADATAAAWRAAGLSCQEINLPEINHFAVSFESVDPKSPSMKALLKLMGL